MKLSEWKALFHGWIDGVRGEVGMPIPALEEFRSRIDEAAPSAEKRKVFEDEFQACVDSQPFLREATSRYLSKKASAAIASATALLARARQVLPKNEGLEDGPVLRDKRAGHAATDEETAESAQLAVTDVWDAIKAAEEILPGRAAAEGESDPRWQAIMNIEDFMQEDPDAIWPFILRWGVNDDEDLRAAIGVLLLEHLLEYHFVRFFPMVEEAARKSPLFADTFLKCWKLGQAEEEGNSERFEALRLACKRPGPDITRPQ
jgi:hypothetical protein